MSAAEQIGVDFLQLVRYGLRDANASLVCDTLKLVDTLLRRDLPPGPCWYRYTGEGQPVDRPEPLWARYRGHLPQTHIWFWSPQMPVQTLPSSMRLGFCLPLPATIRWRAGESEYRDMVNHDPRAWRSCCTHAAVVDRRRSCVFPTFRCGLE